jgi:hypothetical protein
MHAIISLVEGRGDESALPALIDKILRDTNSWKWYVGTPIKVQNLGKLRKELVYYLSRAANKKNCGAILVVLDSDDECPKEEAEKLAHAIQPLNLAVPVAIVFAHREYEAWFLASLPTIAGHHGLPADVLYEGEVESKRDVKGWLRQQMSRNRYNPTSHQKKFTSLIELELAYDCLRPAPLGNYRSFRRLYHAIEQLLEAAEKGERGYVSPL